MRDEWTHGNTAGQKKYDNNNSGGYRTMSGNSRSSQGLTGVGKQNELDRGASLTMAHKAMKLKSKGGATAHSMMDLKYREVSARRQVGDAEMVNSAAEPWWRHVGMEEGL